MLVMALNPHIGYEKAARISLKASVRDSIYVKRTSPGFFVWEGGDRLVYDSVNRWFLLVACQIGPRKSGDRCGARVHDLRHYFATRTPLNWYRITSFLYSRLAIIRMGFCSELQFRAQNGRLS
jgi:hypothetical protein